MPGFYGKLVWLLGLKVCVTTAQSVRLTSGTVFCSLILMQVLFIKIQMKCLYNNLPETPIELISGRCALETSCSCLIFLTLYLQLFKPKWDCSLELKTLCFKLGCGGARL